MVSDVVVEALFIIGEYPLPLIFDPLVSFRPLFIPSSYRDSRLNPFKIVLPDKRICYLKKILKLLFRYADKIVSQLLRN